MPPSNPLLLRAENLVYHRSPPAELNGISLAIEPGRFTLLSGGPESGAGLLDIESADLEEGHCDVFSDGEGTEQERLGKEETEKVVAEAEAVGVVK